MALVEANVDRDRRRLAMRRTGGGGEGGRRERGGKNAKSKTGSNSNVSLTKKGPRPSSNSQSLKKLLMFFGKSLIIEGKRTDQIQQLDPHPIIDAMI